jgi:hypothetical protein
MSLTGWLKEDSVTELGHAIRTLGRPLRSWSRHLTIVWVGRAPPFSVVAVSFARCRTDADGWSLCGRRAQDLKRLERSLRLPRFI